MLSDRFCYRLFTAKEPIPHSSSGWLGWLCHSGKTLQFDDIRDQRIDMACQIEVLVSPREPV